jgi:outer membrane protein assembly factor BamB
VAAFDSETGNQEWWAGFDDLVESAMVTDGAYVFYSTADGGVGAIDAASGDKRWHRQVGDGHVAAPALAAGVLFVTTENALVAIGSTDMWFPFAKIVVLTVIVTRPVIGVWMARPRRSEAPKAPPRRPSPRLLDPGPPD